MNTDKSIFQHIETPETLAGGVTLYIKRDDLIHEEVSGNKWRKLKYFLTQFKKYKNEGVLTFGGAYSNHLVATAAYCALEKIPCVGIVRGEELSSESNGTLSRCAELGMKLEFVSREEYSLKDDRTYKEYLLEKFPNYMIIPEGGSGYLGMLGCQEIIAELPSDISLDQVVVAQGTTTTSCGILMGLNSHQTLNVVPVLKGFDSLSTMSDLFRQAVLDDDFVAEMLEQVKVWDTFHFGGYGKVNDELINFIRDFYKSTGVKLDPVYTGKAMYGLLQKIGNGEIERQKVLFIHTGGIQGARSYEKKYGVLY